LNCALCANFPESLVPKKYEEKELGQEMKLDTDQAKVDKMKPEEYEVWRAGQMKICTA